MIVLFNLFMLGAVCAATYIAFNVVEGAKNKIVSVLGGIVAFVLVTMVLPSPNQDEPASPANTTTSTYSYGSSSDEKPAVDVTLRNYKHKGDNVSLECSGTTGNITCKPKK